MNWHLIYIVYYGNILIMIDLDKIEGFDWDAGNARKSEKHGITQAEAEQIFLMNRSSLRRMRDTANPNGDIGLSEKRQTVDA